MSGKGDGKLDRHGHKRKHQSKVEDPDSSDGIAREARNPKLIARIRTYLEENKDKQYIDIEDMTNSLFKRYPEYGRKKLKIFKLIVEKGFDDLCNQAVPATDVAASVAKEPILAAKPATKAGLQNNPLSKSSDESSTKKRKDEKTTKAAAEQPSKPANVDKNATINTNENQVAKNKETVSKDLESDATKQTALNTQRPYLNSSRPFSTPTQPQKTSSVSNGNTSSLVDLTEEDELGPLVDRSSRATTPVPGLTKKVGSAGARRKLTEFELTYSTSNLSMVGGVEKVLVQICKLMIHLKHPEVFRHIGVTPSRGILLHGPPGCGKTLIANAVAGEMKLPMLKLAATEIVSGISGESESKLRALFDQAMAGAPCILFIDEIDAITQKRDHANKGMESRIVGQLLACMDDLSSTTNEKQGQVLVIGATNRPDALDPALRRAGRFESEIAIGIPDENARKEILDVISRGLNISPDFEMRQLARMTPGYVGADLSSLLREAAINAVNRILHQLQPSGGLSGNVKLADLLNWFNDDQPVSPEILANIQIDLSDFEKALKTVQPSSMREGFATVPNVTWADIGALDDIREELEVSILAPVNHPELTEALGLESPTGILLCGPPGCGKTLLAKAVANQAGINFISVKGPELLNMYVGESERAVRQVFQRAKNSAPCVIFFDELDALAPRRSGSGDSSGASRVVNQLLTEMDGVEGRRGVYIMAATNRVDIIDPAVLRPGRLQKILHVGLPSAPDRVSILRALTKRRPLLAPDVNFGAIAADKRCDGFTGADLSALVTEASVSAFKDHISSIGQNSNQDVRVFRRHFESAFQRVKPSVVGRDKHHYEVQRRKQLGQTMTHKSDTSVQPTVENVATPEVQTVNIPIVKNEKPALTSAKSPVKNDNIPESPFPRYLEKMEVRIKDSCTNTKIAGQEGIITCVVPPDLAFLKLKGEEGPETRICLEELEPFIPEPDNYAKSLIHGTSEDAFKVINYYSVEDFGEEDESVTVRFENGDIKIFPLEQLCKIQDDRNEDQNATMEELDYGI